MKFWQGIALYLFFRYGGVFLGPILRVTGTPFAVADCLVTLALGALMLAGNAPARRSLLRVRLPLLGWALLLAVGLDMLSKVTVVLAMLLQPTLEFSYTGSAWLQVLYVVILAPITEELVIRGALVTGLCQRIPWKAAVVISALLFMRGHSGLYKAPQTLLIGLVLGYLCWYTGSMMYGIVVHLFINGGSAVQSFLSPLWTLPDPGLAGYAVITVAGLVLSCWVLRRMLRCADRLATA